MACDADPAHRCWRVRRRWRRCHLRSPRLWAVPDLARPGRAAGARCCRSGSPRGLGARLGRSRSRSLGGGLGARLGRGVAAASAASVLASGSGVAAASGAELAARAPGSPRLGGPVLGSGAGSPQPPAGPRCRLGRRGRRSLRGRPGLGARPGSAAGRLATLGAGASVLASGSAGLGLAAGSGAGASVAASGLARSPQAPGRARCSGLGGRTRVGQGWGPWPRLVGLRLLGPAIAAGRLVALVGLALAAPAPAGGRRPGRRGRSGRSALESGSMAKMWAISGRRDARRAIVDRRSGDSLVGRLWGMTRRRTGE